MSLPALDYLKESFPAAEITVVSGPRPKELFAGDPRINRVMIFDRQFRLLEKIKFFYQLKKEKFDLVVDLRNSLFGMLSPDKNNASLNPAIPKNITHMRDRHLYKVARHKSQVISLEKKSIDIKPQDKEYIKKILSEHKIEKGDKVIVVAAGARSHIKRWPQDKFVELIPSLIKEFGAKIVLVGDKDDAPINKYIAGHLVGSVLDLSGKTTLGQLAALLSESKLLITNDSASLHLSSYLNIPVVAIFGPTNEIKYGPWSDINAVVKKDIYCRPCEKAQCKFGGIKCMEIIQAEDVLRQVRKIMDTRIQGHPSNKKNYNRILVVRTDRIGDVLLSTPVIKALRDNYPQAFISMMVSPYAKDIVEGNPYLDEVIIFDKNGRQKSWWGCFKFSRYLKKKKFDLALVLHPTHRVHLVIFHSGIPQRVGYNSKHGFLLTDKIEHTKQRGEKHELEYNLDLVRYLGFEPENRKLLIPIKPESDIWAQDLLKKEGISKNDKLLAINPGASCPSKIWPNERFAEVADKLVDIYGFKVLVVAGPRDTTLAANVIKHMHHPGLNLAGRTSVSQLASLLKRCSLFISNDSGPVHIGSAVGVPVISIFGRSQAGLSPRRWGPRGERDQFLHKQIGCIECLAHNCIRGFLCLKAITVEDVLNSAASILGKRGEND